MGAAFRHQWFQVLSRIPMDGYFLNMSKHDTKKYKDLNLNLDGVVPCIERHGGSNVAIDTANAREHKLKFSLKDDNVFLLKIFPVSGGVFSLGKATGHCPETFEYFADKLVAECVVPTPANLNVSLPNFAEEHVASILEFLSESGAKISEESTSNYRLFRVVGPLGDTLVIKYFKVGTVQFQGKYRRLAISVSDYLCSVLSLDEVIKAQTKIFAVDLTVQQVKDGLQAEIPLSHGFISEAIKIQLSSAFALTKIALPVEDYTCVAFPALRGLEGFIKDLLIRGNLKPAQQSTFGDYFRDGKLGKDYAAHVGGLLTPVLDECYGYYYANRHRSFHMDAPSDASRILDMNSAQAIVHKVFELIESSCKRLAK